MSLNIEIHGRECYLGRMRNLQQPARSELELPSVLDALSDPTRLAIVLKIVEIADPEARCRSFLDLGSKTNLTYHFAKLREAGVVTVRQEGVARYLALRRADLDARFPGLLDSIIASARRSARPSTQGRPRSRRAGSRAR